MYRTHRKQPILLAIRSSNANKCVRGIFRRIYLTQTHSHIYTWRQNSIKFILLSVCQFRCRSTLSIMLQSLPIDQTIHWLNLNEMTNIHTYIHIWNEDECFVHFDVQEVGISLTDSPILSTTYTNAERCTTTRLPLQMNAYVLMDRSTIQHQKIF